MAIGIVNRDIKELKFIFSELLSTNKILGSVYKKTVELSTDDGYERFHVLNN